MSTYVFSDFIGDMATNQNYWWTISPADLDKLTRFCPENETSLLTMNDSDVQTQEILASMGPIIAAPDSGFGGSQDDDGHMKGVMKPQQKQGSGTGRGRGRARFVPPKKDEEVFIARQIQEVLRLDGAASLSNKSHTSNKKIEEKQKHEAADNGRVKPRNRGRGKRSND